MVEYLDHITPGMDAEVSKVFQRMLKKQGLTSSSAPPCKSVEATKTKAKVTYKLRKDDSEATAGRRRRSGRHGAQTLYRRAGAGGAWV